MKRGWWLVVGGMLVAVGISGCAGVTPKKPIQASERVAVEFACRFPNGELAAATNLAIGTEASVSPVFRKRTSTEPLMITAGTDEAVHGKPGRRGFEGEIVAQLGEAAVGKTPGEAWTIELAASVPKGLPPGDRFLEMARTRMRPKEVRMSRDMYLSRTGKEPEAGQSYTIDPTFPGKVVSATEQEVVIEFSAEAGAMVDTPLGKGKVRDAGSRWEVEIDAKAGDLVRSGSVVGRIVSVEERVITIDYGHPFGGEKLACEAIALRKGEGQQ